MFESRLLTLLLALLMLVWMFVFLRRDFVARARLEFRATLLEFLALGMRRGLALPPLLRHCSREHSGRRQQQLQSLHERLQQGERLSTALHETLPACFPASVVHPIQAAEGKDHLPGLLQRLAHGAHRIEFAQHRLTLALLHPALLGLVLIYVQWIILDRSRGMGFDVGPAGNFVALALSLVIWVALALAVSAHFCRVSPRRLTGLGRRIAAHVPHLRELVRGRLHFHNLQLLANWIRQGEPLDYCLRQVAACQESDREAERLNAAARLAESGAAAQAVWRELRMPPSLEGRLVAASPLSPARLGRTVDELAQNCEALFHSRLERLLALLQPAAVLFFGSLLALQFASIFRYLQHCQQEMQLW